MNLQQTLDAARNVLRFRHMSYRTEQAYVHWITRRACRVTCRWCSRATRWRRCFPTSRAYTG